MRGRTGDPAESWAHPSRRVTENTQAPTRRRSQQEASNVPAGRLIRDFESHCSERGIHFHVDDSVRSPDGTTLFCTAGMQRLKPLFLDTGHTGTLANLQACLRLNDLDEVGDATHHLAFGMLGLFSFRSMALREAVDFWLSFLDRVGLHPDEATVHPDMLDAWSPIYAGRLPVRVDPECRWSDGEVSGYCTELYRGGVEIGNIVNPLGTCIDAGFGLERLAAMLGEPMPGKAEVVRRAVEAIVAAGYEPGPKGQGYELRRLLRLMGRLDPGWGHPLMRVEAERRERARGRYERFLPRHPGKPAAWWWDTHGVDLDEFGHAGSASTESRVPSPGQGERHRG